MRDAPRVNDVSSSVAIDRAAVWATAKQANEQNNGAVKCKMTS